jgi:hypothetical protein
MLKRWRPSFNLATDYFSYRHIWVLLPGFPLNLWNIKALTAIGNILGCFLKVDKVGLKSSNKILAKVLVEIDITAGLMDMLEVEWHGHVMLQCLDYQGIMFHCNLCHRIGHLRRTCSTVDTDGEVVDPQEIPPQDAYLRK